MSKTYPEKETVNETDIYGLMELFVTMLNKLSKIVQVQLILPMQNVPFAPLAPCCFAFQLTPTSFIVVMKEIESNESKAVIDSLCTAGPSEGQFLVKA